MTRDEDFQSLRDFGNLYSLLKRLLLLPGKPRGKKRAHQENCAEEEKCGADSAQTKPEKLSAEKGDDHAEIAPDEDGSEGEMAAFGQHGIADEGHRDRRNDSTLKSEG